MAKEVTGGKVWRPEPFSAPSITQTNNNDLVRLEVNLNKETAAALKALAKNSGVTITETVRRSIGIYKFMMDNLEEGRIIQVMDQDGGNKVEITFDC